MLLQVTGVPRLVTRLMMDRRVPLRHKLILPAALVYLILPIDIVPDIVPVLGRIDDVVVLLGSLVFFLGTAPKGLVSEHLGRGRAQGRSERDGNVIDGSYRIVDEDDDAGSGPEPPPAPSKK